MTSRRAQFIKRQVDSSAKAGRTRFFSYSACILSFGFLLPAEALGRVGGGQGYGGGGNGGDGDGAGAVIWLIFELVRLLIYLTIEYPIIGIPLDIIVIGGLIWFFLLRRPSKPLTFTSSTSGLTPSTSRVESNYNPAHAFDRLRKFDPNFSEIVFTDFCYTLYAKAHHARGTSAALAQLSPYLSDHARKSLLQLNTNDLREVKGIIIGGMKVAGVRGLETPVVNISLIFEANYTEVSKTNNKVTEMTYYVRERWELERNRDVLSPTPAQATALHCPRCGAALQQDTTGACAFCNTRIDRGEFQWFVRNVALLSREAKGPLLTSDVPEAGTHLPSVVQPGFESVRAAFEKNNENFSWGLFQTRARLIFDELQSAWSNLDWEKARPHETDNLFQMHQYWIEAYQRQHLRNVLDRCTVTAMQPVKIVEDAFYNAITMRIGAQGFDYTIDDAGKVVAGSKDNLRRWSEYWTFIRNRQAKPIATRVDLNCPNCGAPLKVNHAGVCQFCGGKITSGEFDWVLSKIEQDESYGG